jgi:hypothetical protein
MTPVDNNWALEAREERELFDSLTIPQLHDLIHQRNFGRTNSIWYSIADRSTLRVSAWPLLEVLERRSVDRSFRYHAAAALLRLMDSHEWSADALSDDSDADFDTLIKGFRLEAMDQARRSA